VTYKLDRNEIKIYSLLVLRPMLSKFQGYNFNVLRRLTLILISLQLWVKAQVD